MPNLHLTCFKTFQVTRDGEAVTRFHSVKTRALLVYLAVEQGIPHQRETLAGLLWPDLTDKRARRNLSQNLMELRRSIGDAPSKGAASSDAEGDDRLNEPPFLLSDTQTIEFNMISEHLVDALAFAAHLKTIRSHTKQAHSHADPTTCPICAEARRHAVDLYAGPFLANFSVADSDLFENWVATKREQYHRQAVEAFGGLSSYYEQQGERQAAQEIVRRLLEMSPWQEEAHRQLMRLLALSGQRTQALAQYDLCCQALEDELGVPPSDATNMLYDQILAGEFEAEQAVAPATFLDVSGADAPPPALESMPPPIAVPDPTEPIQPPLLGHFVGRQREIDTYAEQLATEHLTVLSGMAGAGKTALAINLTQRWAKSKDAEESTSRIFWHAFHQGEGTMTLIWKLATFLAWHGQDDLWQMLQKARLTGGQPSPTESLFDYLLQLVHGQGYLLCLDDLHLIDEDATLRHFLGRLQNQLVSGKTWLIVTTRQIPDYLNNTIIRPLRGLTAADMSRLAERRSLVLDGAQLDALYTVTEGNAQLVNLALDVLNGADDRAQILARLASADNIERFLLKEVDDNLNDDERDVLIAAATLQGHAGTRHALEAIADSSRIRSTLRTLTDRHLLVRQQDDEEDVYNVHAVVRAFYYDQPSRRHLRVLHSRAAAYYNEEEPDRIRAALHYAHAGKYAKAAKLATDDIWSLVNQGNTWPLHNLLVDFQHAVVEPPTRARVDISLGELQTYMGASDQARTNFNAALKSVQSLPKSPSMQALAARACLGIGNSFGYESAQSAVKWLQRGLAELDEADQGSEAVLQMAAELQIRLGVNNMHMGNFAHALQALQMGLDFLPVAPSRLRTSALLNMGNVYYYQGDLETGSSYTEQALTSSQLMNDDFQTVAILSNIGIDQLVEGAWATSVATLEDALALARRLGDIARQTEIELTLGIVRTKQGDDEAAYTHLSHVLERTHQHGLALNYMTTQIALADLYLRQGEQEEAKNLLMEAEQSAGEAEVRHQVSDLYRAQAWMYLQSANDQQALTYAQQAVDLAQELNMTLEEGMSLRVLGEVLAARGDHVAAARAFEESLDLLTGNDPYERARTQLAWGQLAIEQGDTEKGQPMLATAYTTFASIGAKRELLVLKEPLQSTSSVPKSRAITSNVAG